VQGCRGQVRPLRPRAVASTWLSRAGRTQAHLHARRRAIERRALWMAEDAARKPPKVPPRDALQLVHPCAERGSPRYEKAALRRLERYSSSALPRFATSPSSRSTSRSSSPSGAASMSWHLSTVVSGGSRRSCRRCPWRRAWHDASRGARPQTARRYSATAVVACGAHRHVPLGATHMPAG
jgi:hypothetical protein